MDHTAELAAGMRLLALRSAAGLCYASASDPLLAPGLEGLLAPVIADSDAHVEAVLASQQNLSASIDRLVSGASPACPVWCLRRPSAVLPTLT